MSEPRPRPEPSVWNGVDLAEVSLEGPRLLLRRWRPDDAAAVFEGTAGDAAMREFLPIPDPYTEQDAHHFVTELGHEGRGRGAGIGGAVVESASGQVVGGFGLRLPLDHRAHADIGYSILPGGRGHGYAAEVADVLSRWAFDHGLQRVEIRCSVRNIASAKSALGAGFRFEGIRRADVATRSGLDDGAAFARLAVDTGQPVKPVLAPLPVAGLSDGVITLRVCEPGDTTTMVEELSDPVTVGWSFNDEPVDPKLVATRAAAAGLQWLVGPVGQLTMVESATGRPAGGMQIRLSGPPRVGAIGYGVHPAFRGHGYTTRALRLLTAWAFGPGGFHRLELGAKVANTASRRSAENAGFIQEAVARGRLRNPDGSFADEAKYALVRPAEAGTGRPGLDG